MTTDDPLHECAEALRATGRHVEPTGDDLGLWNVDGTEMTDRELMALAARIGLRQAPECIQ